MSALRALRVNAETVVDSRCACSLSTAEAAADCSTRAEFCCMIPEEHPEQVEADIRRVIAEAAAQLVGVRIEVKRLLLALAWQPDPRSEPLVRALQHHASVVFGEAIPTSGTPLYTDVRLYGRAGVPAAIYGAGPRTVLESNAKRADEHIVLDDLRRATKVVSRTLYELLGSR